MIGSPTTFAIATTLKQSLAHTKAYLHYHLNLKPDLFIVFFDDPHDPAADYAAAFDRTRVFRCDQAHWQRVHGGLPERMQRKQLANLNHALEVCREANIAWLISIDADELIHPLAAVREDLGRLTADVDVMTLPPLEAVRHRSLRDDVPFAAIYHKVLPTSRRRWLLRLIARADARFTQLGFFGHILGKSFHRVATTTRIASQHGDPAAIAAGKRRFAGDTVVLHHDCVGFEEWKLKWSRRVSRDTVATALSPVRWSQHYAIEQAMAQGDETELRTLYRSWFEYSMPKVQLRRSLGFMRAIRIDRRLFDAVL